jgi:two-component system, LytTR family, response regulator
MPCDDSLPQQHPVIRRPTVDAPNRHPSYAGLSQETWEASGAPLRALIAEDEAVARQRLQALCTREDDIEVVACVESAAEAVETMIKRKPNLLLLDVQLRRSTAFDLLHAIPADPSPLVVFTTAHSDYAVQAFKDAAVDYLLKPYSDERFRAAIARVRARAQRSASGAQLPERRDADSRGRHLIGEKDGRFYFLNPRDIESVVAARNWVCMSADGVTYLARISMRHLEARLAETSFVRIHKSFMINLDHVRHMERRPRGAFEITMRSGTPFRSSPIYRSRILLSTTS